ncbi:rCG29952 [Rattus norvegicus]|uniref:RCG29952 n=1 Tax=Rattus norvegicus TaxID=10116 RepID=A6ILN6_RAT|nr:rCG29952 [Rattus norvegicus]
MSSFCIFSSSTNAHAAGGTWRCPPPLSCSYRAVHLPRTSTEPGFSLHPASTAPAPIKLYRQSGS